MLIFLLSAVCVLVREWVDSSMELTETHRAKPNINNWRFLEWNDKKKEEKKIWKIEFPIPSESQDKFQPRILQHCINIKTSHLTSIALLFLPSRLFVYTLDLRRVASLGGMYEYFFDSIHIQTAAAAVDSRQHNFRLTYLQKGSLSGVILHDEFRCEIIRVILKQPKQRAIFFWSLACHAQSHADACVACQNFWDYTYFNLCSWESQRFIRASRFKIQQNGHFSL